MYPSRSASTRHAACALALALASLLPTSARADLAQVSASGFTTTFRAEVKASPEQLWALIGDIARWWSDSHTWSGKAANLSLELRAGGCWCERWEAGGRAQSVEHLRVVMALPFSALRLHGGLGPLQDMPLQGVLNFRIAMQNGKTVLAMSYRVAGAPELALDKLASAVHGVMEVQFKRLVAEAGPASND